MDCRLIGLFVLVNCAFVGRASGSALDLLVREFQSLKVMDREMQVTKRVSDVMALLSSPLERSHLTERGEEGTMCDDNIETSCSASVHCSEDGTSLCNPLCDSSSHGGVAHFYCKCKDEYTAQLCNVDKSDAKKKCDDCMSQGGKFCYTTSGSDIGYFCFDDDYKIQTVTKRGLDERDEEDGEKLSRMARVLHAYIRENL